MTVARRRVRPWVLAAVVVAVAGGVAVAGASGSGNAWGQWRGSVVLSVDQTWFQPGVPNGNGDMTYHRFWKIVWKLNDRPPPDPDKDNDGDVAAGPASMTFTQDDVGKPNFCGDIARRTGSVEGKFRDMLTLDGSLRSSDQFVWFQFQHLKRPTLNARIRTEYSCGTPGPNVDPYDAGGLVTSSFQVQRRGGYAGSIIISRTRIAGEMVITCEDWQENPPRTKAMCEPAKMKTGWMKSVYKIKVDLTRQR